MWAASVWKAPHLWQHFKKRQAKLKFWTYVPWRGKEKGRSCGKWAKAEPPSNLRYQEFKGRGFNFSRGCRTGLGRCGHAENIYFARLIETQDPIWTWVKRLFISIKTWNQGQPLLFSSAPRTKTQWLLKCMRFRALCVSKLGKKPVASWFLCYVRGPSKFWC